MAKAKPPNPFTLRKWILKYPKELKTDGSVIYCNVCDKALQAYKKHHVDQHVLTGAHKNAAAAKSASTRKTSQALIAPSEKGGASNSFHMDLVKMLISANIPIYKVNNSVVRAFFKKYMQQHLPDESTLRKLYLTPCYEQVIQDIREDIGDNCLYVAVDETTDCMGRYMAHVVVGKLDGIAVSIPHLLLCRQLSNANSACVARLVDEAMCVLWPEGKHAERLVLFLSDAAPYMVKTGKDLSIFYPNLTHVTCLAHGLHRVAETIRSHAKSTNKLVSSVRKIFCKAPQRVALFQSANPGLKLPPEPVLTRWGTWVAAVSYYAENFDKVAAVIKELNPKDADAISKAQAALELPGIREEVTYIHSHFSFLPGAIEALEKRDLPLTKSVDVVKKVNHTLASAVGPMGELAKSKLQIVMQKNPGFNTISQIHSVLCNESVKEDLNMALVPLFKFAPLTSVEVERTFSTLKWILSYKRCNLTVGNLEKLLVIHSHEALQQFN